MTGEKTKTIQFNEDGIKEIPDNKPAVYEILTKSGENIYTGIAKRGRVKDRLNEHLSGGPDPIPGGKKVKIIQKPSIDEARKSEKRIISRVEPKHNK